MFVGAKTEPTLDHSSYLPIYDVSDAGQTTRVSEGSVGGSTSKERSPPPRLTVETLAPEVGGLDPTRGLPGPYESCRSTKTLGEDTCRRDRASERRPHFDS